MTPDSDTYLLQRIKKDDDEEAFELIFKKHYKLVYNYARYNIKDETACHDITQDVFTYLWEMRSSIEIKQTLKSYLLSASHNASINYLKKETNKQRHLSNFFHESAKKEDGYDVIFEGALIESLNTIVSNLPTQCKEIFYLSRLKGLKHKEIAKKLGISPRTVETQIYRALRTIKSKLP